MPDPNRDAEARGCVLTILSLILCFVAVIAFALIFGHSGAGIAQW